MTTTKQKIEALKQKTLGGSQLYFRGLNDCLTIKRGPQGVAQVESKEGEWSREEINAALTGCILQD